MRMGNKLWYSHTGKYYTKHKLNKLELHVKIQINQNTMLTKKDAWDIILCGFINIQKISMGITIQAAKEKMGMGDQYPGASMDHT